MSHRCGPNCRRKQVPSTRRDCPSCGSATKWLRRTFRAGGQDRQVSHHFRTKRAAERPEVTEERVKAVLDNWVVRCKTDYREEGAPKLFSLSHWGWVDVDGRRKMMQVVTRLDGSTVLTVNLNRKALKAMRKGDPSWFNKRCVEPPMWRNEDDASSEYIRP